MNRESHTISLFAPLILPSMGLMTEAVMPHKSEFHPPGSGGCKKRSETRDGEHVQLFLSTFMVRLGQSCMIVLASGGRDKLPR